MVFGNWEINDEGIVNYGNSFQRNFITKHTIGDVTQTEDADQYYSWPIEILKFDHLSEQDIADFNTAFAYAMGRYNQALNARWYRTTLKQQDNAQALKRIQTLLKKKKG